MELEILGDEQQHAGELEHQHADRVEENADEVVDTGQQPPPQYSPVIRAAFMEWMLGKLADPSCFGKAHNIKMSAHLGRTKWESEVENFLGTLGTTRSHLCHFLFAFMHACMYVLTVLCPLSNAGPHARRRDIPPNVYAFLKKHEGKKEATRRQKLAEAVDSIKQDFYKQQDFPPFPRDERLYVYIARMDAAISTMMANSINPLVTTVRER